MEKPSITPSSTVEHEKDKDRRDLKPLLDYLANGRDDSRDSCERLSKYLHEHLPPEKHTYCLVVSLPDPIASVASGRFDEYLDVLQRAIELQGYTLTQFQLPWEAPVPPGGPIEDEAHPGLMVFKEAAQPRIPGAEPPDTNAPASLVLAFLVRESPILGIRKRELARVFELIDSHLQWTLTDDATKEPLGARKVLHIVAPSYSNSQRSLEAVLKGWGASRELRRRYHFRLIASGADRVMKKHLENMFSHDYLHEHSITFSSMTHNAAWLRECIRDFIQNELGYKRENVVVLAESNTGLAPTLAEAAGSEFIFPLRIADLRKAYARTESRRAVAEKSELTTGAIKVPPDEGGIPRDLPKSYTPDRSAVGDELSMIQILTTINARNFRAVGIAAVDPLDMVFLARQVRQYCPNVRLFALQADLLLARPPVVDEMRGMIIASTYTLNPANQWRSLSCQGTPHIFFGDEGSQALYNAIVAHLWEMDATHAIRTPEPPLLEVGWPYGAEPEHPQRPPVWISAVGERGLVPLKAFPEDRARRERDWKDAWNAEDGYFYNPKDRPEPAASAPGEHTESLRLEGMRPTPHILFWLICVVLWFACLLCAWTTWLVMVGRKTHDSNKAKSADESGMRAFVQRFVTNGADALLSYLNDDTRRPPIEPSRIWDKKEIPPERGPAGYVHFGIWLVAFLSYYALSKVICYELVILSSKNSLMSTHDFMRIFALIVSLLAIVMAFACAVSAAFYIAGGEWWRRRLNDRARTGWMLVGIFTPIALGLALRFALMGDIDRVGLHTERFTGLPSGLSPLFPVLFLGVGFAAYVHSQLERRRLYRAFFLSLFFEKKKEKFEEVTAIHFLDRFRTLASAANRIVAQPWRCLEEASIPSRWLFASMIAFLALRACFRGLPGSLEGALFDLLFWGAAFLLMMILLIHTLQLHILWGKIRGTLQAVIELPMQQAFDRIPARFKGWFFEAADPEAESEDRERLVIMQNKALKDRCTPDLIGIFSKVSPSDNWKQHYDDLRDGLGHKPGEIDSTRRVYPFLFRLWEGLPVEDVARLKVTAGREHGSGQEPIEWIASWPLTARNYSPAANDDQTTAVSSPGTGLISRREHEILRDWTRLAEDLLALQLVRYLASPLAQLLPIMRFLVLGSLSLLLAVTSYPFEQQSWVLTVLVVLILLIGVTMTQVILGVNRNELISRVSDTTPGKINFDNELIVSLATHIVPLIAALVAVSFDLSDLLHTWLGPLFQRVG